MNSFQIYSWICCCVCLSICQCDLQHLRVIILLKWKQLDITLKSCWQELFLTKPHSDLQLNTEWKPRVWINTILVCMQALHSVGENNPQLFVNQTLFVNVRMQNTLMQSYIYFLFYFFIFPRDLTLYTNLNCVVSKHLNEWRNEWRNLRYRILDIPPKKKGNNCIFLIVNTTIYYIGWYTMTDKYTNYLGKLNAFDYTPFPSCCLT